MRQFLSRYFLILFACISAFSLSAQDTTRPTSVDPELLSLGETRVPKEFTISSVKVTGAQHLDTAIVLSISGLQAGDKIMIPGGDAFSKAITNLWRQRLFSDIQVFITNMQEDKNDIEINEIG